MQISFEKRKKLVIVNIFLQQFQCLYSTILLLFICNVDDVGDGDGDCDGDGDGDGDGDEEKHNSADAD